MKLKALKSYPLNPLKFMTLQHIARNIEYKLFTILYIVTKLFWNHLFLNPCIDFVKKKLLKFTNIILPSVLFHQRAKSKYLQVKGALETSSNFN